MFSFYLKHIQEKFGLKATLYYNTVVTKRIEYELREMPSQKTIFSFFIIALIVASSYSLSLF
ncbi:MAG: hypothetical protein JW928_02895, partial [Candidatus Aureabacteria bacterium]|nr:hypothetical protein [Candidatus Auribacterota bacterium]